MSVSARTLSTSPTVVFSLQSMPRRQLSSASCRPKQDTTTRYRVRPECTLSSFTACNTTNKLYHLAVNKTQFNSRLNTSAIYPESKASLIRVLLLLILLLLLLLLTPWFVEPGGSIPYSQGLSNNPYPEPNQPNSSYCYLFL